MALARSILLPLLLADLAAGFGGAVRAVAIQPDPTIAVIGSGLSFSLAVVASALLVWPLTRSRAAPVLNSIWLSALLGITIAAMVTLLVVGPPQWRVPQVYPDTPVVPHPRLYFGGSAQDWRNWLRWVLPIGALAGVTFSAARRRLMRANNSLERTYER
jgi:hypothetical protein